MDEKIGLLAELNDQKTRLVLECIEVVKNTPTTHAYTTYQLSLVEETINRCVKQLKNHFNIRE